MHYLWWTFSRNSLSVTYIHHYRCREFCICFMLLYNVTLPTFCNVIKVIHSITNRHRNLRGVEWVHDLFLFSFVLGKMKLPHAKLGLFLCSLDNLLQKNIIVFFFGNQISKWRSFEKRAIFDLRFTFFSYQGKVTKIPSAHISLTYIHVFCSPYWLFLPYQFWKKYEFIKYGFSLVWVLVLILIRAILEQSINNKMVSKI